MRSAAPEMQRSAGPVAAPSKRGRGQPPTHGLSSLIDRRTTLGKQLAAWRADLVRDLGGDVSTQQARPVPSLEAYRGAAHVL